MSAVTARGARDEWVTRVGKARKGMECRNTREPEQAWIKLGSRPLMVPKGQYAIQIEDESHRELNVEYRTSIWKIRVKRR